LRLAHSSLCEDMKFGVVALAAPVVSAWDGWSDCGSTEDMATLNSVVVSPDPPVKGVPLTFTFDMTLKEDLVGGTIDLDLKAGDIIPVPIKETDDLCETFSDIGSCPVSAGPLSFSFEETVPKLFPEKHVHGTIQLTHSDSRNIACIKLDTTLGSLEGEDEVAEVIELLEGEHGKDVLIGMIKGMLSDTDDVQMCELDGISAGAMFGAALADLKAHKFVDVATDLSIALGKVQPLVNDCGSARSDVETLLSALKQFSRAEALANIVNHRTAIFSEMAAASECKKSEDYPGYGKHLGAALRHVLEAEETTDNATTISV